MLHVMLSTAPSAHGPVPPYRMDTCDTGLIIATSIHAQVSTMTMQMKRKTQMLLINHICFILHAWEADISLVLEQITTQRGHYPPANHHAIHLQKCSISRS